MLMSLANTAAADYELEAGTFTIAGGQSKSNTYELFSSFGQSQPIEVPVGNAKGSSFQLFAAFLSLDIYYPVKGTVSLDTIGPPTWSYTLTHEDGYLYNWTYEGDGIIGATVTGEAKSAGWIVEYQDATRVTFANSTPLTSGSVSGFEITGIQSGTGSWHCGLNSGSIDGSLPVELSLFIASVSSNGVTLRWRTESEIENLGFNVYRSISTDGEFTKINPTLIKRHGTAATPYNYTFIDETVQIGSTYLYRIENVDFSGKTYLSKIIQVTVGKQINVNPIPKVTVLMQNFPNPFNPETWIPYQLALDTDVTINIYNITGQIVRTLHLGHQRAGVYIIKEQAAYWDGRDNLGQPVASGIYYYTMLAGKFKAVKKMVILR